MACRNRKPCSGSWQSAGSLALSVWPGYVREWAAFFPPRSSENVAERSLAAKRLFFRYKHKHIRGCTSTSTSYMPQTEGYTDDQTIQTRFTFSASDARWLFVYSPVKGITKQRIEVSALQCCFLKILMTSFTPGPNLIALFCFYGKYFIQFYFSKNSSKAHTCDDNRKSWIPGIFSDGDHKHKDFSYLQMRVSSKQSLISNTEKLFLTVLEPGKHKITVPELPCHIVGDHLRIFIFEKNKMLEPVI